MTRVFAVVAMCLTATVTGTSSPAFAQSCGGSAEGNLSAGFVGGRVTNEACSSDGTFRYGYIVTRELRAANCPGSADGMQETFYYRLPGSEVIVRTVARCTIGGDAPDPGLPAPPSVLELFRQAPLPPPEVHINPRVRGLVGMETWLWWGADIEVPSLSVAAGEWSASIEVQASRLSWDMGNGDVVTAEEAGTGDDDPSATYVYERKCDCTVTLTVEWSGVVTLTHPAVPTPIVQPVGPVAVSDAFPYEVMELEAVIVR